MTTEIESVDSGALESLKQKADAAHVTYSEAFHRREECEKKLAAYSGRRAGLIAEYRRCKRSCETALQDLVDGLIDDPTCGDPSSLTTAQTRSGLLKLSVQKYSAHEAADAEQKVLEARVVQLAAQLQFEKLRAEVQESELYAALAPIAEKNGGVALASLGPAAAAHRELIADLAVKLTGAREQLRSHADETQAARDNF